METRITSLYIGKIAQYQNPPINFGLPSLSACAPSEAHVPNE